MKIMENKNNLLDGVSKNDLSPVKTGNNEKKRDEWDEYLEYLMERDLRSGYKWWIYGNK